jgi:hypothetical protein
MAYNSFRDVSCDGLRMIAIFVDVYWAIIRLHEWHITASGMFLVMD